MFTVGSSPASPSPFLSLLFLLTVILILSPMYIVTFHNFSVKSLHLYHDSLLFPVPVRTEHCKLSLCNQAALPSLSISSCLDPASIRHLQKIHFAVILLTCILLLGRYCLNNCIILQVFNPESLLILPLTSVLYSFWGFLQTVANHYNTRTFTFIDFRFHNHYQISLDLTVVPFCGGFWEVWFLFLLGFFFTVLQPFVVLYVYKSLHNLHYFLSPLNARLLGIGELCLYHPVFLQSSRVQKYTINCWMSE